MRTSQPNPASGRSANSQRPERSRIDSVTAVRPTTIRLNQPLDQDAGRERRPKDRRQCPTEPRVAVALFVVVMPAQV
jgi:hypothetical protein